MDRTSHYAMQALARISIMERPKRVPVALPIVRPVVYRVSLYLPAA